MQLKSFLFLVYASSSPEGRFYEQIDGVALGSPLASLLANIFMDHLEKNWLETYNGPEVIFYRRYVDDTFCLFNADRDAKEFIFQLHQWQAPLRFSMEKEVNHTLPFLGICIDNYNLTKTTVFRKKTFLGLFTNS